MRRLFPLCLILALHLATAAVVWTGLLLPSPLWILKYGLHAGCRPTGRTWQIDGIDFGEIGKGISLMGSQEFPHEEGTVPAGCLHKGGSERSRWTEDRLEKSGEKEGRA